MPEDRQHVSHLSIKVEGTLVSEQVVGDLMEVTVDHSLHLPSMFSVRLLSHDMHWLEDTTFREGKKIEIGFGESPTHKLLSGKIAALEPDLNEAAPSLVVRGYDLSHALYRGRKRRAFLDVMDSDVARTLAQEAQLNASQVDTTGEMHEYLYQNNQTNAEFLRERAARYGYEWWVEDDVFHFHAPRATGSPVRLDWGVNLRSFRPRLSTAAQVSEVEVRGWNYKTKEAVIGRATNGAGAPQIGISQPGSSVARSAWGEAKHALIDHHVRSAAEAEKIAQASLDELASSFVEAEGTCDGNGELRAGVRVQVAGVGDRFNGTYAVTQVVHHWTKDGGMRSHFTVSGRRDRGVISLLKDMRDAGGGTPMNLAVGLVTDNNDPSGLGRVKVKFPWLAEADTSTWARIAAPMAGNERGFFYLPEIDDEVLVGFEHGDIHRPYIIGCLWNGKDKPPIPPSDAVAGNGAVNKRVLKSRSGHIITLNDTDGGEEITIVDKTGNDKFVIHSPDNSMEIKLDGDLKIEAKGKITLKAMQGVDMSSDTDFKISGQSGVDVNTTAQLKLTGTGGAELTSTAQTKVGGTTVDMQGSGMVQVTGGVIKLN